jgi:hypothetical protein
MITPKDEEYVLAQAYVPEHIVSLMVLISKGEPSLIEDHLVFVKDNWLILIGYPLDQKFSTERSEKIIHQTLETFRPEILLFIGPQIPASLLSTCQERETDEYHHLDLEKVKVKASLQRAVDKASQELTIERGHLISKEHEALISELLKREKLPPRVRGLYRAMPDYVFHSSTACVLNARDKREKLCAFYIIELGAKHFSTYVLGTHSKKHYVPHASDLLFFEMIKLTREHEKNIINLGLGVNQGIRRFKEKWGGVPSLHYEFCECSYGQRKRIPLIEILEGKL